jgi:hypothetical protein
MSENDILADVPTTPAHQSVQQQLTRLFAHKGEWLNQELYDLYYSPSYLPELQENQSCVLIGGRGTGKTTVLKGLSYEGQHKLVNKNISSWRFIGVYHRIDSNTFSALKGLGLSEEDWQRPFAHYINLVICNLVIEMLAWSQRQPECEAIILNDNKWVRFQKSLALPDWTEEATELTIQLLSERIELAITQFEIYINNILDPDIHKPTLSILGSPITVLLDAVHTLPQFAGKPLYILFDEYESFADYQQRIVNTLIKQSAGRNYCFKIGVRELGWRVKHTLNDQELASPNDFRSISINDSLSGATFKRFAESVCNRRLAKLKVALADNLTVKTLLPGISNLEESKLLGVEALTKKILSESASLLPTEKLEALKKLHPMQVWFAHSWETQAGKTSLEALQDLLSKPSKWNERFKENYIYATLFAIKGSKSGTRKFYAGWDTYVRMASGNIRFILQLVEASIREQIKLKDSLDEVVSPENQTQAAYAVGYSNLQQLEGVDVKGRKILKLVQGIGRIFEIFAADPFGRTPEVVQFSVPELNGEVDRPDAEVTRQAEEILESAFSYLALQRTPSNKLEKEASRGYDYSIHPIFSAYFRISNRKKRKTTLYASDIIGLINNPKETSDAIIARTKKDRDKISSLQVNPSKNIPDLFSQPPISKK